MIAMVNVNSLLTESKLWLHRRQLEFAHHQQQRNVNNSHKGTWSKLQRKSNTFHIHAWRWHHLGIVRDLGRLQKQANKQSYKLCPTANSNPSIKKRIELYTALMYILKDNWKIHDKVEQTLLFPWLLKKSDESKTTLKSQSIISTESKKLNSFSDQLSLFVDRWARNTQLDNQACMLQLYYIERQLDHLRSGASNLFQLSENMVMPQVLMYASDSDQKSFNDSVLARLSGREVRVAAVGFKDAVEHCGNGQDKLNFGNNVPSIVRKVAIPYWRKKLVRRRDSFLRNPAATD